MSAGGNCRRATTASTTTPTAAPMVRILGAPSNNATTRKTTTMMASPTWTTRTARPLTPGSRLRFPRKATRCHPAPTVRMTTATALPTRLIPAAGSCPPLAVSPLRRGQSARMAPMMTVTA